MTQTTDAHALESVSGPGGKPRGRRRSDGRLRRLARALEPVPWVAPATALILFVVIWPVIAMFQTSRQSFDSMGFDHGSAGWTNFTKLFDEPVLDGVLIRTVIWVVAVVTITMVTSLGVAQLFNKQFPGRKVARWALIAPWAASVVMTAIVFRWMLDPNNGALTVLAHDLGLVKQFNSTNWLSEQVPAFCWEIFVAVFVSVPFTTYALLAGLQAVPSEVYEAAKLDGASVFRTYWSVTLPLLRPALLVACLINVMNVFNSFPIIYEMNGGNANSSDATTTIFMYTTQQSSIGEAAAMSVVNFGFIIVIVLLFLRASKWNSAED
ncbi:sugar ABC transporter permease [Streptacidiphilus sp. PB12-B1b]|uniref:carbohydrate ABC transporter permease n=1 Tax=Streptacidiphilus sp. PB12-B1b TaxID=2705012 RepID=UPI0015F90583|nr:sugar ABC transporter permease [Streptacidiphilus sp. PB12-B1b]QMU74921.1 sugar ABC transporter permease [Streptacidiphilus sp. PB12-B1b]